MTQSRLFTPVLIAGSLIMIVSFGIRASFGVFQLPVAQEFGWLRSEFSLAIAIQNLAWGFGQPVFSAIAEKFGDRKAIILGALTYAAGLALSAYAVTPGQIQMLEILVGFGIAGTGFGVILAVVGRATADEHRSMALGIATAAGSAGQVVGPPVAAILLGFMNWTGVFTIFACLIIASLALLPLMKVPAPASRAEVEETMGQILNRAFRDPSYILIFVGFFSCGYQLGFITAHFPAFIAEICGPIAPGGLLASIGVTTTTQLGAWSIALIGLANIAGTIYAGTFIVLPMTPLTVIVFSITMGSLWLATVPLTSGLIAHIYGLRYMGTLYGIVFFSHQVGSFMGVWLGGKLYDLYGTYTVVWWVGVGIGAFSAIVHLPIRERRAEPVPA